MKTVEERILKSIRQNGYPEKKVTLPFQAVFKSCKKNNTPISEVLGNLETEGVHHEMVGDRILFFHPSKKEETPPGAEPKIPEELHEAAMERLKSMDPREMERIREQVMKMSPEKQQELLKQAREYFRKNS